MAAGCDSTAGLGGLGAGAADDLAVAASRPAVEWFSSALLSTASFLVRKSSSPSVLHSST